MKYYEIWTLGKLIETLKPLGEAQVRGLSGEVFSYRGYYERNCTYLSESSPTASAEWLADQYGTQIGDTMHGWKGGEYTIKADEAIYFADRGDTGPAIVGFELADDGVYEPVLCDCEWW